MKYKKNIIFVGLIKPLEIKSRSARRFVIFILTLHFHHRIKTETMIPRLVLPSTADPVPKHTPSTY